MWKQDVAIRLSRYKTEIILNIFFNRVLFDDNIDTFSNFDIFREKFESSATFSNHTLKMRPRASKKLFLVFLP